MHEEVERINRQALEEMVKELRKEIDNMIFSYQVSGFCPYTTILVGKL